MAHRIDQRSDLFLIVLDGVSYATLERMIQDGAVPSDIRILANIAND